MLKLEKITYQPQSGNKKILDKLDFQINTFEIILICGKSGSGKTTLLEIICGLINQQQGNILWNHKKMSSRQRRWLCGVVFQFPERYFIGSTIGKELSIGHKSLHENDLKSALNKVGLSEISLKTPPEVLSGGQQRRLAVAVQLLRNPNLILLDEPTAGLDWSMKNEVINLIDGLKGKNTILMVTHEPKLFETITTKTFILEKGKLYSLRG